MAKPIRSYIVAKRFQWIDNREKPREIF